MSDLGAVRRIAPEARAVLRDRTDRPRQIGLGSVAGVARSRSASS